jgi:HEAT repeat protein
LLKDSDQAVAKAAVHGLAQQDQAGAGTALSQLLNDASAAPGVRCEAALALGDIKQPWVLDPLSRAAREAHDANVAKAALDAIGKLDFSDTRGFFQDYIQSANTSSELRVDAIDAVAASQGDPNSFLAQLAANHDLDSEARAEAAWAMSATDVTGNNGAQLLAMLQNETDPDVRLRLYQALNNQDSFDTAAALAMVQKENDPTAIAVGLETLAKALAMNGNDPQLQSYFDQTGINQLKQLALNTPDLDTRQKAVIALTALAAAHNPAAVDALNALHQQLDPKSTQAGSSASSHSTRPPGNPSPSPGP